MDIADVIDIYLLCSKNNLYYQYCPPFVTEQSILDDMQALPPNKDVSDKYYIGYYKGEELIAVMDLIMAYPDEKTAFIGFFMTAVPIQNTGIGSGIIDDLCGYLRDIGFSSVRLGWVRGNPQAEHFWHKNNFMETGTTYDTDSYTVVVAQRIL
ncbi:MAG: GNAT family N-acetyltransferase [Oscillibacter sp.]|nr:GNAT family N-acetyltransferase [Oscillibacter sp.]